MFDITRLNKSSFRGIPFYTEDDTRSGGQRLTDHKFINAGTLTESNGIDNDTLKISGYIGGNDYLENRDALIEAFKNKNSGILIDKFHGEIEVFIETWSISESRKRLGYASLDFSFKLAQNNLVPEPTFIYTRDIRPQLISNFEENFNNSMGEDVSKTIADNIASFLNQLDTVVDFLDQTLEEVQGIKAKIGSTIAHVKGGIISIDSLTTDIGGVFTSFDNVLDLNLHSRDQKSAVNTLRTAAETSSTKTASNEIEKLANIQSNLYILTVCGGLIQTYIKNLENITFTTGDDFGSVKDDLLTLLNILEESIKTSDTTINGTIIKFNLISDIQSSRQEFITYYTGLFSSLQNLQTQKIIATTDVFSLTLLKYNDISRYEEILINNNLVDPFFVNGSLLVLAK